MPDRERVVAGAAFRGLSGREPAFTAGGQDLTYVDD